ncbi:MAG: hypothetical protein ABSB67_15230 [Bryobacteraceae bacterium]|jgi:hypothetical protein
MFVAYLTSVLLLGQAPEPASPPDKDHREVVLKLPEKLRPLMGMVTAAPPEFGAQALERMLESGGIDDPPTRRELIERAFQLASQAHDHWRVRTLPGAGPASVARVRLGELRLDRLSLQTHAVRLMLALDKSRARDLFLEMPKLSPEPLTCDDWVGPDPADFYTTLAFVFDQSSTPAERAREDDIHLIVDALAAITSPLQFHPALSMINGLHVTPAQRHLLLAKLGSAMSTVPADDRSYQPVVAAITPGLPAELLPALQIFMTSHSTAQVCSASEPVPKEGGQSPEEKQVAADEMNLMFKGGTLISKAGRDDADWQQRFEAFLAEMTAWQQGTDESASGYFHRKMTAYEGLLDVTSGPLRARLVDEMVGFAIESDLQRDSPEEWFFDLRTAEDRVRTGSAPGPDVLQGFERSGHPILVLEAALDRALGK